MNMQQHEDEINRIENTYKNIKPLSKNPTGNTYLARNVNTNELVVKKQVSLEAGEIYGRLQRLDSEHLVPILEVCFEPDKCIIVESYIPGETMEQYLERRRILADDEARFFAMQILEGLAVIHKNGLIHRDITPSNILISKEGVVKIIDFGIARTKKVNKSKDTTILGTTGYAAPEQFGFTQTDAKTDIYAFGVLLNQMLTGTLPNEQLPKNRRYRKIVKKCTKMEPKSRYFSVVEIKIAMGKKTEKKLWETDGTIIPGFRRDILWHKIVAVFVYIYNLIGLITVGVMYRGPGLKFGLVYFCNLVFWIAPILIMTNFLRWENRVKFYRRIPFVLRFFIRVILSVAVMVLAVCGMM